MAILEEIPEQTQDTPCLTSTPARVQLSSERVSLRGFPNKHRNTEPHTDIEGVERKSESLLEGIPKQI